MANTKPTVKPLPTRYQLRVRLLDLVEVTELVPRSQARAYRLEASRLRMAARGGRHV